VSVTLLYCDETAKLFVEILLLSDSHTIAFVQN